MVKRFSAAIMTAGLLLMLVGVQPVSAHICPAGGEGLFYEDISYGGVALHACYGQNVNNLANLNFNDTISSFVVGNMPAGRGVDLYEHVNYGGAKLHYCGNISKSSMPSGWNDRVSSIHWISTCPQ